MGLENNGKLRVFKHLTKINDSKSIYNHIRKICHRICCKALIQVIKEGKIHIAKTDI